MIRKMIVAACVGAALLVSACASLPGSSGTGPPPDTPIVSGAQTTLDEKALASVELAYNTAGKLYLAAVKAGWKGEGKDTAKRYLMDAAVALSLARQAYLAGNAESFAAQVGHVTSLVGQASALIPKKQ